MRAALDALPFLEARNPNRSSSRAFSSGVFFRNDANCSRSRRYEASVFFDSPSSSHRASANESSSSGFRA
jgi:hypothetical protein